MQELLDAISGFETLYCTQQTGGLTRGMTLRAIQTVDANALKFDRWNGHSIWENSGTLNIACITLTYVFARLGLPPLLEAGNAGDIDSQRLLAREYTSGKILRKNTTAALHWLKMAEENSNSHKPTSHYHLGHFYEHDNDDSPNYVEATKWYLKAADRGDYNSQKSLGDIYESGKGVPKDYVQAYKWYLLSVANSFGKPGIRGFHTDAIKTRDALAQKMTPFHLAEARQLASDWLDNITSLHPTDYGLAKEGLAKGAS